MSQYILAIDAGTTGITLILLDHSGHIVNKEYSEFIISLAPYLEEFLLKFFKLEEKAKILLRRTTIPAPASFPSPVHPCLLQFCPCSSSRTPRASTGPNEPTL